MIISTLVLERIPNVARIVGHGARCCCALLCNDVWEQEDFTIIFEMVMRLECTDWLIVEIYDQERWRLHNILKATDVSK